MKTKPYQHQLDCLQVMDGKQAFAVLLEQGLGKTKILIDDAVRLYHAKKIDGVLIIAPNGVHLNWVLHELPKHLDDDVPYSHVIWSSRVNDSTEKFKRSWFSLHKWVGLAFFVVNVESLSSSDRSFRRCLEFMKARKTYLVVDESSRIKTPGSRRTKRVLALSKHAKYRRIATGTPVTQSPFDVYTQFCFLDPMILGFKSFFAFKHNFGVFFKRTAAARGRTWVFEELKQYIRLDQLTKLIKPHSYRRTKAECLDLPPKIYKRISLFMTPAQSKLYDAMDEEGIIDFDDFALLAPLQITRLLRMQQITGGFLPTEDGSETHRPIADGNPKLETLITMLEDDYVGKTIIWARFRAEIEAIALNLRAKFGANSVVEFHGGVQGADRAKAVNRFQEDRDVRFIVGQQQSGIGVTLTAADYVFYFSNTFSYEQRYQSEDRAHRIGTKKSVVYIDLEMSGTVDERVRDVLEKSGKLASIVTGDEGRTNGQDKKGRKTETKSAVRKTSSMV